MKHDAYRREKKLCDMIVEMRLSNNLLKSKVEKLQHNIKSNSANTDVQGVLLIKARDGKSQEDVMKILTETVNFAEFNICVNGTKRINREAAVFCKEAADLEKPQKVVREKLGNKFSINRQQKLNPRIMIRNVKNIPSLFSQSGVYRNFPKLSFWSHMTT
nr:unnamed protein product [Callosobruchus analis]